MSLEGDDFSISQPFSNTCIHQGAIRRFGEGRTTAEVVLPGLYDWIGKLGTTLIVWNDDVTYEEVGQPEVYSSH